MAVAATVGAAGESAMRLPLHAARAFSFLPRSLQLWKRAAPPPVAAEDALSLVGSWNCAHLVTFQHKTGPKVVIHLICCNFYTNLAYLGHFQCKKWTLIQQFNSGKCKNSFSWHHSLQTSVNLGKRVNQINGISVTLKVPGTHMSINSLVEISRITSDFQTSVFKRRKVWSCGGRNFVWASHSRCVTSAEWKP